MKNMKIKMLAIALIATGIANNVQCHSWGFKNNLPAYSSGSPVAYITIVNSDGTPRRNSAGDDVSIPTLTISDLTQTDNGVRRTSETPYNTANTFLDVQNRSGQYLVVKFSQNGQTYSCPVTQIQNGGGNKYIAIGFNSSFTGCQLSTSNTDNTFIQNT